MANFFANIFKRNGKLSVDEVIVKKTVIAFTCLFLFFAGCLWTWFWIHRQPLDNPAINAGIRQPLRYILNKNEALFNNLVPGKHLAKEYSKEDAVKQIRSNGNFGLRSS